MSFKPARTAALVSALTLSALAVVAPSASATPATKVDTSTTVDSTVDDAAAQPGGSGPTYTANVWTW